MNHLSTASIALSVADAATALGIGKTKLFELISRGDLPAIRLGGRTLIRRADLEGFVASLPLRSAGGKND